jgi:hypothetical protein
MLLITTKAWIYEFQCNIQLGLFADLIELISMNQVVSLYNISIIVLLAS